MIENISYKIYNYPMKWIIELYEKENGQCPVLEFILSLPPKHRAKAEREIDLLEEFGIDLPYPHTRKIEGEPYKDLWELRIKFASDISRIFYFIHTKNKFVLLHGFIKKTDKTPVNELEKAKKYLIDYLRRCNESDEME
jgi:phage-related protein